MKKKKNNSTPPTAFAEYANTLSADDKEKLLAFFVELDAHCLLSRTDNENMRKDFENAILYYAKSGASLPTILMLLSIENLGGFYARPATTWYSLDNAAKVYPLSMKHGTMAVFRLSAYMKGKVVPELLQMALTFTIKRFPSFATTVKRGFFWHYLNSSKHRYEIVRDSAVPCAPIEVWGSGSPAFRVLYENDRISAEFFHILTDGTGGMVFLQTLVAEYIRLRYGVNAEKAESSGVLDINECASNNETVNGFLLAEKACTYTDSTNKPSSFFDKPALQLGGRLSSSRPCRVIHFVIDSNQLVATAKKHDATVTSYVLALMFLACRNSVDELVGDINIQVPVNMRKFYPSVTLRNFAMYCGVRLDVSEITSLSDIIPKIRKQLAEKASKQAMSDMILETERMVNAVRFVPLKIKSFVTRLVYGYAGDLVFTNTLSNIGVVTMPDNISAYVRCFDCVLGTAISNRASCSMVTYGNTVMFSVTKNTKDPTFEEYLYSLLRNEGICFEVEGSECV